MPGGRPASAGRFASLDGLRGAAALSVVFGHAFWTAPTFSNAVQLAHTGEADPLTAVFTYTPLHLLWLAQEAVIVFFVLSGFVLSRPFITRGQRYGPYYAGRFVRLMLPSWAALLLAWSIALLLFPRTGVTGSWLLDQQVGLDTSIGALRHFTLLTGVPAVLPPLWSLQGEVVFSLLLPLFVVVGRWATGRRRAVPILLAALAVFAAGAYLDLRLVQFLPVFVIGSVLAANSAGLQRWFSTGRRARWLGTVSLLAVPGQWYPRGFTASLAAVGMGQVLSVLGATGLVVAALTWVRLRRVLAEGVLLRWLGRRSFSLYLVHFPLIMLAAFLTGGRDLWVTLLVGLPSALLAAEVFYRLVEAPSMRLSHRLRDRARSHMGGRMAESRTAAGHQPPGFPR